MHLYKTALALLVALTTDPGWVHAHGQAIKAPPRASPTQPARSAPSAHSDTALSFDRIDADSDGRLSKGEAGAEIRLIQRFRRFDANQDGSIDREEYAAYRAAKP